MGSNGSKNSDSMYNCEGELCDFHTVTRRCYASQKVVADSLRTLAEELDEIEKKSSKAQIGLAATGIALTATGIGLSFFTFGSSLVLTAVGTALGASATVGSLAASVVKKVLNSKKLNEANLAVEAYVNNVMEYVPHLKRFCDSMSSDDERERMYNALKKAGPPRFELRGATSTGKLCETCQIGHKIVSTWQRVEEAVGLKGKKGGVSGEGEAAKFTLDMVTKGTSLTKMMKTVTPLATGIKIGSHVLTGVGLIIDIGTIVHNSINLHKKRPSEVAELLRRIADAFEG